MKATIATAVLATAGWASCSDQTITVEPVLDLPATTSDAYPFDGIDSLRIAVAHAGDPGNLLERTVVIPEPLTLGEVPFEDTLVVHISGLVDGVEVAYGRSCSFDVTANGSTVSAPHIYFSRVVKWGDAAAPSAPMRRDANAYSLPDGGAIFAGGINSRGGLTSIERFDPVGTGHFRTLDSVLVARHGAALAPLGDGRAVIIGGVDENGDAVPTVELLSPAREIAVDTIEGPRLVSHRAVTLVNGRVLVTGGESQTAPGEAFAVTSDAWSFEVGDGGVLRAPRQLPVALATARADHTMTRLGDDVGADVLIIGGRDATGAPVASAELYRPLREGFEQLPNALLNIPRWGHNAVRMPGGFILVVGGLAPDVTDGVPRPVAEMELYDPVLGRFATAGVLPAGAGRTDMSVTPLPDGRVLLAGGLGENGAPVNTTLIARLDPINGQVDISVTNALDTVRADHAAARLCDGTVLLVGGTDDAGATAARYNPPASGRR